MKTGLFILFYFISLQGDLFSKNTDTQKIENILTNGQPILKDIHSQSDEFLNYLLPLPGNPKAYETLQASALLRVDVDLLRKLDKYLEFQSPEEVAKARQLIEAAADDKVKRKLLLDYIDNAGDIWKLALQKLGKTASSTVLSDKLKVIGKLKQSNYHAHHITAGGANNINAVNTRLILQREGIDINEAVNGVFLPSTSKYAIDNAVPHANVHTNIYYETVFQRLDAAQPGKVRTELQKIADELLNGTFPY